MDQYYIESGYYDQGYFVYTAEAIANVISSCNISVLGGRLQTTQVNIQSAFSPQLSVTIFKNHTAILVSQFTINATTVANRSSNVLLEHIANLNAQAVKTAVTSAQFSVTATTATNGIKTIQTTSSLSSTAEILSNAGKLKLTDTAIIVNSRFTASRYVGTGRPRRFILETENTTVNDILSTAVKKFGTHSFTYFNNGVNTVSQIRSDNPIEKPRANESWAAESWLYYQGSQTIASQNFFSASDQTGTFFRLAFLGSANPKIELFYNKGSNVTQTGQIDLLANTWYHILTVYDNGYLQIFVNGQKNFANALNLTAQIANNWGSTRPIIRNQIRQFTFLDDVSFHQSTNLGYSPLANSISVPSVSRSNTIDADLLWHFDGNNEDDVSIIELASAVLTSTASISAAVDGLSKNAIALVASAGTFTVNGSVLKSAQANLVSNSSITADNIRIRSSASDQNSQSSLSAQISVRKQFDSQVFSLFSPSITVIARKAGIATLDTVATVSATAIKTTDLSKTLSTQATAQAQAVKTVSAVAENTAQVTTIANVIRIRSSVSAVTGIFNISVDVLKIKQASVSISAEISQSADSQRTRSGSLTVSALATQTAEIIRIKQAQANAAATFTQNASIRKFVGANVNLSAQTNITSNETYFVGQTAICSAQAQIVVLPTATFRPQTQFNSVSVQISAAVKNITSGIDSEITSSLTVSGQRLRDSRYGTSISTGLVTTVNQYNIAAPVLNPTIIYDTFTVSFWARRSSLESVYRYQILRPLALNQPSQVFEFVNGQILKPDLNIQGTDTAILRYYADDDESIPIWPNALAPDTDWHHYLLRLSEQLLPSGGTQRTYYLYRDGQLLTQIENRPTNNFGSFYHIRAYLGQFTGALAQIWAGYIPQDQFAVSEFYQNGAVDLGQDGRNQGRLPQPEVYNPLTLPFQGVAGVDPQPSPQPLFAPTIQARCRLTARADVVFVISKTLTSTSTLAAQVNYRADTQSISISTASVNLQSEGLLKPAVAMIYSQSQLICFAGNTSRASADLTATATLDADSQVKPPIRTTALLESVSTVSATGDSRSEFGSNLSAITALITDVSVKPPLRTTATLTATATLSAQVGYQTQGLILTVSLGLLSTQAAVIRGITAQITAQAQTITVAKKFTGIILNLRAFNTQLTVGNVINIDPYLTLKIKPEGRGLKILPENRIITIESETRVNIIKE